MVENDVLSADHKVHLVAG